VSAEVPVIPLAPSEKEAFEYFRELAFRGVRDIRGEYIEIDLGNYVHVLGEEERIKQIPWIEPTVEEPDQIVRLTHSRKGRRPIVTENYIRQIRQSEEEATGSIFIVEVERVRGRLKLRTWFAPFLQEEYVHALLKKGEVIWP
jgi:hypothetical protein